MSAAKRIMLMGLAETGKTSFLAALWHMVDQSTVVCALKLDKLEGDRRYLNEIREAWLEYKPVPRNLVDSHNVVRMLLRSEKTAEVIELSIPDLSGESFRLQWSKRQMTVEYETLLAEATGAILFLHPEKLVKPLRIETALALADLAIGEDDAPAEAAPASHKGKSWNIEDAPTQVQLVDLLQVLAARERLKMPFRIAIVVSAFDVLKGSIMPQDYLRQELPLLDQFLRAHSEEFEVRTYGISAQGGPYASPTIERNSLTDPKVIVDRLLAANNTVTKWLWNNLDQGGQTALRTATATDPAVRDLLVQHLGGMLGRKDLHESQDFTGITLRPITQTALDANRENDFKDHTDLQRTNRLLFEDTFPGGLAIAWSHQDEDRALKSRGPASRVRVVGQGTNESSDITEPIQWLML